MNAAFQTSTQTPTRTTSHTTRRLLQRQCACGDSARTQDEDDTRKNLRVQRFATNDAAAENVPAIVHEVLRSPGRPLDAATRAFMEPRFGHDFSQVRVHANAKAAESARAVNALAYTAGREVVFGKGQYAPHTRDGQRLIAHELTHVVQQQSTARSDILRVDDSGEAQAERAAAHAVDGGVAEMSAFNAIASLQRKVRVLDADKDIPNPTGKGIVQTNAATAQDYLNTLCSDGNVKVDGKSGAVKLNKGFCDWPAEGIKPAVLSKTKSGCAWLCTIVGSKYDWRIEINDTVYPKTTYDDEEAAHHLKPGGGSGGKVQVPSPNNTTGYGSVTESGKWTPVDPWLILGHELLGHGLRGAEGIETNDAEGRQVGTVKRENVLRSEHGMEARGATFKDPYCGESFEFDKSNPAGLWLFPGDSIKECVDKRDAYNKQHGTKYELDERIQ